jgi:hypothetical protein
VSAISISFGAIGFDVLRNLDDLRHALKNFGSVNKTSTTNLRKMFLIKLVHLRYSIQLGVQNLHIGLKRPRVPPLHQVQFLTYFWDSGVNLIISNFMKSNQVKFATTSSYCALKLVQHSSPWSIKKVTALETLLST